MSQTFEAIIEGYPTGLNGYSIYTNSITQLVDQRNALIADDWRLLETLANQGVGAAYGYYRELRRYDLPPPAAYDFLEQLNLHAADSATNSAFFDELKSQLLALNPDAEPGLIDGLEQMAQGATSGTAVHEMLGEASSSEQIDPQMFDDAIEGVVSLATKSQMAIFHANFNNHLQFLSSANAIGPHGEEFLDMLSEAVEEFSDPLELYIKDIYGALLMEEGLLSAIENLMRFIEEALPRFARCQATIRAYSLALESSGKGTMSEKAGALAVNAGDTSRDAFCAYSSAYLLALETAKIEPSKRIRNLIRKSSLLAYDLKFPNGKNTEISKVDRASDGDYVEIIGKVTYVESWRSSDDKLMSKVTLLDPSSNTQVAASIVFVHLRHLGVIEDSYCRISGTWQSQSSANAGASVVEIEKLSINKLAEQSWRVAFLDLSDRYIERWPGGFNLQFGIAPHVSEPLAGDSESKILGAGELIFKPFNR